MPDYTIRVFKSWGARDDQRRWVNNYELSSSATSPAVLLPVAHSLIDAESHLHLTMVKFLGATISTWSADSEPYNPESFVSVASIVDGLRAMGGAGDDALDSNVCYHITRNVTLGRTGKLFYRGCLLESDVSIQSDASFQINPGRPISVGGAAWTSFDGIMNDYYSGGTHEATFVLKGIHGEPPNQVISTREVTGLVPAGVTLNRRNHRYFDRALG